MRKLLFLLPLLMLTSTAWPQPNVPVLNSRYKSLRVDSTGAGLIYRLTSVGLIIMDADSTDTCIVTDSSIECNATNGVIELDTLKFIDGADTALFYYNTTKDSFFVQADGAAAFAIGASTDTVGIAGVPNGTTGFGMVNDSLGTRKKIRQLKASTNVTLAYSGDTAVTIAATGGGGDSTRALALEDAGTTKNKLEWSAANTLTAEDTAAASTIIIQAAANDDLWGKFDILGTDTAYAGAGTVDVYKGLRMRLIDTSATPDSVIWIPWAYNVGTSAIAENWVPAWDTLLDCVVWQAQTGGAGESTTGSNVGGGAVGIFSGLVGVDMQFHTLGNGGDIQFTLTNDSINGNIGSGKIVNDDINASAGIAYSKLTHPSTDHDYSGVLSGDALVDGGTDIDWNPHPNYGLQVVNDSAQIKLNGSTLNLSSSGLKVTDNTYLPLAGKAATAYVADTGRVLSDGVDDYAYISGADLRAASGDSAGLNLGNSTVPFGAAFAIQWNFEQDSSGGHAWLSTPLTLGTNGQILKLTRTGGTTALDWANDATGGAPANAVYDYGTHTDNQIPRYHGPGGDGLDSIDAGATAHPTIDDAGEITAPAGLDLSGTDILNAEGVASETTYIGGWTTYRITKASASADMIFTDPTTGTKTLAQLAAGGGGSSVWHRVDSVTIIDTTASNDTALIVTKSPGEETTTISTPAGRVLKVGSGTTVLETTADSVLSSKPIRTASLRVTSSVDIADDAIPDSAIPNTITASNYLPVAGSPTAEIDASKITPDSVTVGKRLSTPNIVINGDSIADFSGAGSGITVTSNVLTASLGTSVDLASAEVTGTLPVGNGGTGAATFTDGGILFGNAANAVQVSAVLTEGQLLIGDGTTEPAIVAMSGDGSIASSGALTVSDDSHAHTGSTISGLTGADITDGSVAEPDLDADNSPSDADILTYDATGTNFAWVTQIVEANLPANAIDDGEVEDNSLTALSLGTGSVAADEIATGAVATAEILDSTVASIDISKTANIQYSQLQFSNNIVAGDIATGAVGTDEIAANVVSMPNDMAAFTKAGLEERASDVTDFAEGDGDTLTGRHDFGGAVVEIPNGTTPTVDEAGELAQDTDSADALIVYDATRTAAQRIPGLYPIIATIIQPAQLTDSSFSIFHFDSSYAPSGVYITKIALNANASATARIAIYEWNDQTGAATSLVDSLNLSSSTRAMETDLYDPNLDAGDHVAFVLKSGGAVSWMQVEVWYYIKQ